MSCIHPPHTHRYMGGGGGGGGRRKEEEGFASVDMRTCPETCYYVPKIKKSWRNLRRESMIMKRVIASNPALIHDVQCLCISTEKHGDASSRSV